MESSSLILAICRALQILFAAVVLGTSGSLTHWLTYWQDVCHELNADCNFYGLIPAIEFGVFVGALGMLDALVGMASAFVDAIPYLVQLGLDVLACLSYLAGGAAIAGTLGKSGGCNTGSRCTEVKADDAFQFLGFIITAVIIGLSFMWRGRSGRGSSYV